MWAERAAAEQRAARESSLSSGLPLPASALGVGRSEMRPIAAATPSSEYEGPPYLLTIAKSVCSFVRSTALPVTRSLPWL